MPDRDRLACAAFQDQVDRLRRQRAPIDVSPLTNAPKHRAVLDIGFTEPAFQQRYRPADQERMFVVVAGGRLRSAQADGEAGEERGVLIGRIGTDGLFVGEVLDVQCCQFGPSMPPEANATRSRPRSRTSTRRSSTSAGMPWGRILGALHRIPELVADEFEQQARARTKGGECQWRAGES